MSKQSTKPAADESTKIVAISEQMPAYLAGMQENSCRGMEDVTANDVIIPRLEVVQSLSPVRDKTSPTYIPGVEEGMLYNNVTRATYGTEAFVVPVMYKKQWLVWKDRKQGGGGTNGFRGAFNTELEAKARVQELSAEEQGLIVVDTAQHFCYLMHADGSTEEIVVSMSKSKAKVSKRWNSLMRIAGGDSFSRVYKISTVVEANAKGEKFQNMSVALIGYVPEVVYRKAEALYNRISGGGVVVSHDYDGADGATEGSEEF